MTISEKIKNLRKDQRMTQAEVADKLGVERSYYGRIETKAGNRVHFDMILKVCHVFGLSIKQLLDYPEPSFESNTEELDKLMQENKALKKQYTETRIINQIEQVLIGILLERSHGLNIDVTSAIKDHYSSAASFVALQFNKDSLAIEVFGGTEQLREFIHSEKTRQLVDSTVRSLFYITQK